MSSIHELSTAVRVRRFDMGLTQMSLATISGLSRATVNQVENGTIKDLSLTRATRLLDALGLSISIAAPRKTGRGGTLPKSRALDIAARTASVSYRLPMNARQLRESLTKGLHSPDFMPHMHSLLDEAPVSLLASVVEQVHEETGMDRAQVWKRMRELAHELKSSREIWQ